MSERKLTDEQIQSRQTLGRITQVTGILFVLFGIYVSIFLIPDVIQTASGPQSLTLEEAAEVANEERTYVQLTDGTWDCDTVVYALGLAPMYNRYDRLETETKSTEIFLTGDDNEVVVLVVLSGEVECADVSDTLPAGYLYAMSDSTRQELTNDARLARYFMTDTFIELCGYCGRDNSLIGAVFGVISILSGVGLIIWSRNLKNTSN